ncbi:hypothetical protein KJ359_008421 [Pestalotiopsis sp. 9143b]|nr:hypothetical protein KJ359_008421 [Pestalotiopsis sp. 9143b]
MALGAEELAVRRARDDEAIIREAFERHGHWRFARYLAKGYQGTCYKLERKNPATGAGPTNIAFKVSGKLRDLEFWDWKKVHRPSELDDENEGPAERDDDDFVAPQILKMLQNSSHTAHWIDVSPNPALLDRSINAPAVGWQYMQWLPNGTLKRFQDRWRRQNVPIPNRLLWSLFLCCEYIRSNAAMLLAS